MSAATFKPACSVCGCTEQCACIDEEVGLPCSWAVVPRPGRPGICTRCLDGAERITAVRLLKAWLSKAQADQEEECRIVNRLNTRLRRLGQITLARRRIERAKRLERLLTVTRKRKARHA